MMPKIAQNSVQMNRKDGPLLRGIAVGRERSGKMGKRQLTPEGAGVFRG